MAAQSPAGPPPTMMTSSSALPAIPAPGCTRNSLWLQNIERPRVPARLAQVEQMRGAATPDHRADELIDGAPRGSGRCDRRIAREHLGNVEHANTIDPVLADE